MTNTKLYNPSFYRAEIERISLELTQPITQAQRKRLQGNLDVAKRYLAEVDTPEARRAVAIQFAEDACKSHLTVS